MRIVIVTIGSEGDIRPYIALALELKRLGQEVQIATAHYYSEMVSDFGIACIPMDEYTGVSKGIFNSRLIKTIRSALAPKDGFLEELWKVCQGADCIIYNSFTYPCFYVAEKLGIPCIGAFVQPHHSTRAFPHPFITKGRPAGGVFNLLGFRVFDFLYWRHIRSSVNKWRVNTLHAQPLSLFDTPARYMRRKKARFLYGYNPALVPRPRDWHKDEIEITGYWYFDTGKKYEPTQEITDFLAAGEPPVFLSVLWNTDKFNREAILALAATLNRRIIVHDLYEELENMTSTGTILYIAGPVPHEWLFPKLNMAIHHGGLGISMNCIRAGLPMVVIPAAGVNDHRFWAYHLEKNGLAIHLPLKKHDKALIAKLIKAIRAVSGADTVKKAKEFSENFSHERGIHHAGRYILNYINEANARSGIKTGIRQKTGSVVS